MNRTGLVAGHGVPGGPDVPRVRGAAAAILGGTDEIENTVPRKGGIGLLPGAATWMPGMEASE